MNEFEHALGRYLDERQLERIRSIKIGIAGAGGLGSNCAVALVRTGFRRLKIVDFDAVDHSNLNRQFYFLDQVGRKKVEALAENLKRINPSVEIKAVHLKLGTENISQAFADCSVVVEALDVAESKKMIVESCINKELLVSASGLAGWGNSDRIRVRKVSDNFYVVGDLTSGIGAGLPPLAPCVTIAAAKQADVVLSYVLGTLKELIRP